MSFKKIRPKSRAIKQPIEFKTTWLSILNGTNSRRSTKSIWRTKNENNKGRHLFWVFWFPFCCHGWEAPTVCKSGCQKRSLGRRRWETWDWSICSMCSGAALLSLTIKLRFIKMSEGDSKYIDRISINTWRFIVRRWRRKELIGECGKIGFQFDQRTAEHYWS